MVWVRSEYAGELAVLSAWIAAVLPWNVTYSTGIFGGSLLFVRFPFFQVRYASGLSIEHLDGLLVSSVVGAIRLQSGQGLEPAYLAWGAAASVLGVAVVLSVAYYADEATVEAGPVDPVRLMGGLLGLAAVLLSVATYFVKTGGFGGIPIPVGVVVLFLLAGALLGVERR